MIDIQFVRDNPEAVKEKSAQKGYSVDVSKLLEADEKLKKARQEADGLRQKRNDHAAGLKTGKPGPEQVEKGKQLKEELSRLEEQLQPLEAQYLQLLKTIPNMPLDEVPVGSSEEENKVMATVGEKPAFDFEPKSHIEIGEAKGWIDKQRAAKVAGARFVYLKGDLVRLEMALMQYGVDKLTDKEFIANVAKANNLEISAKPFIPVLPPAVARSEVYEATGRLDKEETTYKLADDDLWLNASAEHTLVPMHKDEVLAAAELPIRYIGYTTAFRREAGSYGKDTEGIIRLHQFNKLEMESFTAAKDGINEHILQTMLQRKLVEELGLPYQLLQKCTADIGGPNASGWDINCWMPGQNNYRETHTADYMTDYQARSLKTRVKTSDGKKELVHTNDATVFADRILVAIIENNQTKNGDVKVPKVLQKYMGGQEII